MHRVVDARGNHWRIALGLSAALHVAVLVVLRFSGWPTELPTSETPPIVVWLSDWRPPQPVPIEEPQRVTSEPVESSESEAVPEDTADPAESELSPSSAESGSETLDSTGEDVPFTPIQRSFSWRAEARRTIVRQREAQEQADNYVTFGFPFESVEGLNSRERDNSSAASDRVPERDSYGDLVLPAGDNCQMIVGTGSILAQDAFRFSDFNSLSQIRCTRRASPKPDMFEEQKPEYLN
jgi:hypothetical protein